MKKTSNIFFLLLVPFLILSTLSCSDMITNSNNIRSSGTPIENNEDKDNTNNNNTPPPFVIPDDKPDDLEAPIKNPYFTAPIWKLWSLDPTPVALNDNSYELPTAEADRLYPAPGSSAENFLATTKGNGSTAGYWDDAYVSDDGSHSMIPTSWTKGKNTINLNGQFIRLNGDHTLYGGKVANNNALGLVFTSQSTTCMGHNLVEGTMGDEKNRYFSNSLRSGPSFYSYRDHVQERSIDSFKTLPVFTFNSFGRSGSEVHGVFKMLLSGGFLTRQIKDKLKRHGLYPSALLYIYKAALPYADASGKEVEYTNELRHRMGYLSNGDSDSNEFMPYNKWYHKYDNQAHLKRMTEIATNLKVPPPIAIIKFVKATIKDKDGKVTELTTASRVGWSAKMTTHIYRFSKGESITVEVDVGDSYDLNDLKLSYKWTVVYPEHKNVSITKLSDSRYSIAMTYNANLPKGKIPIILTVNNGGYDSNPAVLSFYPAETSTSCSSYQLGATPENEVNVNLRPLFSSSSNGNIEVKAGNNATFKLSCTDPEGFKTTIYRWLNEPGTIDNNNNVTLKTDSKDAGKTIALHFICSDGTGGYNSLEQKVIVTAQ